MLKTAVAAGAALVALAFALSTYERWLERRRRHEAAWTAALAMFCLASGALAAGSQLGWTPLSFRIFYLFGAILNVPFLALGTIYLLAGPRRGDRVAAVLVVAGAFAAGVLTVAPFTSHLDPDTLPRGSEVFGALPRALAAVASSGGALVIFGGAVWSAVRIRRGRAVIANGLIALGTLVLAASGLLNSVLGEMTAFALSLLAGITVLFVGFLVATGGATEGPTAIPAGAASHPAPSAVSRRT
jgi:hypothetical protein